MRIAYIAHNAEIEGAGIALLNTVTALTRKGIKPYVVLPRSGRLEERLMAAGARCVVFRYRYRNAVVPYLRSLKDIPLFLPRLLHYLITAKLAERELMQLIKREEIELVHTNTGVIRFAQRAAKRMGVPHVWHLREYLDKDFGITPLWGMTYQKRLLQRGGNYNVTITQGVADHFETNSKNSHVVYDGVFAATATGLDLSKKSYLLYVGSLQRGKGVHTLIEAYAAQKEQLENYELWIVGTGHTDYEIYIKQLAKELGCEERVKFLGFQKGVYQLMAEATALVVPSAFEGFGFITAEAMLNHCIVIGHNTAGTKEQFDNGVKLTGSEIALRYNTATELEQHLAALAQQGVAPYREMTERAYHTVRQLYTSEESASQLLHLYNNIRSKQTW